MKTKKELLEMLDELKYAEVFEELDKLNLPTEAYNRLKKEFILGKTDIDFHDRLRTLLDFQPTSYSTFNPSFFKSKAFFLFLLIGSLLIISILYFSQDSIVGIRGNNNDGNSIHISK